MVANQGGFFSQHSCAQQYNFDNLRLPPFTPAHRKDVVGVMRMYSDLVKTVQGTDVVMKTCFTTKHHTYRSITGCEDLTDPHMEQFIINSGFKESYTYSKKGDEFEFDLTNYTDLAALIA